MQKVIHFPLGEKVGMRGNYPLTSVLSPYPKGHKPGEGIEMLIEGEPVLHGFEIAFFMSPYFLNY